MIKVRERSRFRPEIPVSDRPVISSTGPVSSRTGPVISDWSGGNTGPVRPDAQVAANQEHSLSKLYIAVLDYNRFLIPFYSSINKKGKCMRLNTNNPLNVA